MRKSMAEAYAKLKGKTSVQSKVQSRMNKAYNEDISTVDMTDEGKEKQPMSKAASFKKMKKK